MTETNGMVSPCTIRRYCFKFVSTNDGSLQWLIIWDGGREVSTFLLKASR
ncbi:predicted protein [Sclerotinia sclerotiorum 1980 UF-70]|uniref:Uncharacterized protein n=1 Tax=Sclerotinia sclerotiorum (strain ATCC 18683 / 1980 / Ss-1) TaxID=665079 RepID=A7F5I2_SCLS1|nr:predicted protein [Sclerotinia sclerotiorum 1980 UF-70]EDN98003.1 predicted protein [Sclerotinia sclerotiorum 1980 UF-70]